MLPTCMLLYMHTQVGDMETAHTFYEQGLGLLYDPSVKSGQKKGVGVSWLSVGHQQVQYVVHFVVINITM